MVNTVGLSPKNRKGNATMFQKTLLDTFCGATQLSPTTESLALDILQNHFFKFRYFAQSLHTALTEAGTDIEIKQCRTTPTELTLELICGTEETTELVHGQLHAALSNCEPEVARHFTYNIESVSTLGLNISIINNAQLKKEDDLYED